MMYRRITPRTRSHGNEWLDQVFQCRAAETGGVIKRQILDVEKEVGLDTMVAEVRRRGFRMLRTRAHVVIVCDPAPVHLLV